ncbi:MAG TPA: hypothetical protein VFN75_08125 [Pseudonocardiaceae bacterium]|nr:hypothetical protein [Pseudonocardiaceae bacterium]
MAGDPFDISVGGTDIRRFISHLTATQLSWMRGEPTTFGKTASSMELSFDRASSEVQNEGPSPFMGLRCADWPH